MKRLTCLHTARWHNRLPHKVLVADECPAWRYQQHLPITWQRSAKRKSIVKASILPQGALPPLDNGDLERPSEPSYPPVLQQHLDNVRKFRDCVVLTRVGDFYEMYFDQVEQYAPLVNLKKAKRVTALGPVPMAGFQHTQLDRYLKMFVQDLGQQVALSEQIRLPTDKDGTGKSGGPLYDRKVTRIVTAGTLIDENFMDPFENNYLLSVHVEDLSSREGEVLHQPESTAKAGLSWVDLSSGNFFTQACGMAALASHIARIRPREIVMNAKFEDIGSRALRKLLGESAYSLHFQKSTTVKAIDQWYQISGDPIPFAETSTFSSVETAAGSLLLDYIADRLLDVRVELQAPVRRTEEEYMVIDKQSLKGLEIRSTMRDRTQKGSLLHTIRRTITKGGARLLSERIVSPSLSLSVINRRLDLVEHFLHHDALREDVRALLRSTSDAGRTLQRFVIGKGDADDMLSLARTIHAMRQIYDLLVPATRMSEPGEPLGDEAERGMDTVASSLQSLIDRFDLKGPVKVARLILEAVDEEGFSRQHQAEQDPTGDLVNVVQPDRSAGPKEGTSLRVGSDSQITRTSSKNVNNALQEDIWIMRRAASTTLNRAHCHLEDVLFAKCELVGRLRSELKTDTLTLKWSSQLGHFCHVKGKDVQTSLSALAGTRTIGSTKTTRSFYLQDWTQLGASIDDAKLRIRTEEERVFDKLQSHILDHLACMRRNAAVLDELDVACSSAIVAKERNLIRPILHHEKSHRIIGGRHPTVDIGLQEQGRRFTPNDCLVGSGVSPAIERIYLITGANMAGKSTYLRQNALITILAQTGCFVPADYASMGLVDRIFSRVGSADNLYQDQSTFMVEMLETAEILRQATSRSFVIMDEVGRGTTPEDGLAVAYACLHHLHNHNKSRTLFATHFHALADMTREFDGLVCHCTDVVEAMDGSWAYVHKIRKGVSRESHALKVARLAGLPEEAIRVADDVLRELHTVRAGRQDEYEAYTHRSDTAVSNTG